MPVLMGWIAVKQNASKSSGSRSSKSGSILRQQWIDDPYVGRINAQRNGRNQPQIWFYHGRAFELTRHFCLHASRETNATVVQISVKQIAIKSSGSRSSKSGSILRQQWILDPYVGRTNAQRNPVTRPKTGFYHGIDAPWTCCITP